MLWNAFAYQGLFDPIRSSLREREIVDQVSSRGCVPFDIEPITWMILQPLNIVVQDARVRWLVMVIPGKHDFVHVLVESFLVGTIHSHAWPRPVSNPESNIRRRC